MELPEFLRNLANKFESEELVCHFWEETAEPGTRHNFSQGVIEFKLNGNKTFHLQYRSPEMEQEFFEWQAEEGISMTVRR